MNDIEYNLNDIVITHKTHACGGNAWQIVRVGLDYKIKCLICGRIIMMDREDFKKIVKHKQKID